MHTHIQHTTLHLIMFYVSNFQTHKLFFIVGPTATTGNVRRGSLHHISNARNPYVIFRVLPTVSSAMRAAASLMAISADRQLMRTSHVLRIAMITLEIILGSLAEIRLHASIRLLIDLSPHSHSTNESIVNTKRWPFPKQALLELTLHHSPCEL